MVHPIKKFLPGVPSFLVFSGSQVDNYDQPVKWEEWESMLTMALKLPTVVLTEAKDKVYSLAAQASDHLGLT